MAKPREGYAVLFLEVPEELKARLQAVAAANERSTNREAVFALKAHIQAEERRRKPARKRGAR
jgi:plasmid stability protein